MNSGTSSTELNDMFTNFVNYVDSFYGQDDPLYPMMSRETNNHLLSLTSLEQQRTTYQCVVMSQTSYATWGDGDSLDRERVRDILLEDYNYKFVGE